MSARTLRLRAALACALALSVPLAPATSLAAGQTPFSKLPHLFFGAPTPAPMIAPSLVIARYENALAALPSPRFVQFAFSIEQVGARDLSQTHEVYRDGPNERDETTVADGVALRRPDVRIFRNRTYRYQISAVAPHPSAYAFRLTSTQHDGDHDDYSFAVSSRYGGAFQITNVVIDGARYLPTELDFHIATGSMRGQGHLSYGRYDKFWLVREAEVSAHGDGGREARERIVWSQYSFPDALPASTFNGTRPSTPHDDDAFAAPAAPAPAPAGSRAIAPAAPRRTPGPAVTSAAAPLPVSTPAAAAPVKPPRPHPTPAAAHVRPFATSAAPGGTGDGSEATPEILEGPVTPAPLRPAAPTAGPGSATPPPPAAPAAAPSAP